MLIRRVNGKQLLGAHGNADRVEAGPLSQWLFAEHFYGTGRGQRRVLPQFEISAATPRLR